MVYEIHGKKVLQHGHAILEASTHQGAQLVAELLEAIARVEDATHSFEERPTKSPDVMTAIGVRIDAARAAFRELRDSDEVAER